MCIRDRTEASAAETSSTPAPVSASASALTRVEQFQKKFSAVMPTATQLVDLIADPECGVTVRIRPKPTRATIQEEYFPPCFVGAEAVTWMVENIPAIADDRSVAIGLGKVLVRAGYVLHVFNNKDFEDSPVQHYTFNKARMDLELSLIHI